MIQSDKTFIRATNCIDDSNEARFVRDNIYYIKYHGYEMLSFTKYFVEINTEKSLADKIRWDLIGRKEVR